MTDSYQDQLRQLISHHFNEEELRMLCFSLGVDDDDLGGRGKAANARELIATFQRRLRLVEGENLFSISSYLYQPKDNPENFRVDDEAAVGLIRP